MGRIRNNHDDYIEIANQIWSMKMQNYNYY